jgi:hypothetical protein
VTPNLTIPTPDVTGVLARVAELLEDGNPSAALAAASADGRSAWLDNAQAVCLLRLGKPDRAAELLRRWVFDPSGLTVRADAHPLFEANYATALLMGGNPDGFHGILGGIRDRSHPAVVRLLASVRRWKSSLGWGEWAGSFFGGRVRPLILDTPPGAL